MSKASKPRSGSMQYWPRSRARKILPSVNWNHLLTKEYKATKLLGFIAYKVGMLRVLAKDVTANSMSKNKQIIVPVTVIECPPMKVFSIRFYYNNKIITEVHAASHDKELQRRMKLPKQAHPEKIAEIEKNPASYTDIRIVAYSVAKKTSIKKTPDIAEIALSGSKEEKLAIAKELLNKEISVENVFDAGQLVDIHAVTKGEGTQGPVARFGLALKQHKTEKGVRKPGTLGPWKPARISFRAPLAGQLGFFSRVQYNNKIIAVHDAKTAITPKAGFNNYGVVSNPYLILRGSVQGPAKRPVMVTAPTRPTKSRQKQNFEVVKILN